MEGPAPKQMGAGLFCPLKIAGFAAVQSVKKRIAGLFHRWVFRFAQGNFRHR